MSDWICALKLDKERKIVEGSTEALKEAVGHGADLRSYLEFIHNEHIDLTSDNAERVPEVAEYPVTYVLEDSWVAGIMSLRQPIHPPVGFGPRPSMSFYVINQNAQKGFARPFLDGVPSHGKPGRSQTEDPTDMPKYHTQDNWDSETNAPSSNYTYDFEVYRFCVCDTWQEVLSHDAEGKVISGSLERLREAFVEGCGVKVAVTDLCSSLTQPGASVPVKHEVFVATSSGCYYASEGILLAGSHPVIRIKPAIPLRYESGSWDFGWLVLRTDGRVVYRRCDPYTFAFKDIDERHAIRWFVR